MAMTETEKNVRLDELNELSKLALSLEENKALSPLDKWQAFQQGLALRGILMLLGVTEKPSEDEEN